MTLLTFTGIALILLGAAIWRFKWIHLLSNINVKAVNITNKSLLARFAGGYIMLVGVILLILGYLTKCLTTERELLPLVGGSVVVIFLLTGIYLAGLGRYTKK